MSCFNEDDVLDEVIAHWIAQGCHVHVVDNWSTDRSWTILEAAAARLGSHLTIERFPLEVPEHGSWHDILVRKADIAFYHKGRWIIHTDADEIRVSPFCQLDMADSLRLVEVAGWNRVKFTVLNHRPIDDRAFLNGSPGAELPYFEYVTKPGHFIQQKAWLEGNSKICL